MSRPDLTPLGLSPYRSACGSLQPEHSLNSLNSLNSMNACVGPGCCAVAAHLDRFPQSLADAYVRWLGEEASALHFSQYGTPKYLPAPNRRVLVPIPRYGTGARLRTDAQREAEAALHKATVQRMESTSMRDQF